MTERLDPEVKSERVSEADIKALKRSGLFDEKWYLEQYPDVRILGLDAAEHYLWIGRRLGRKPMASFDGENTPLSELHPAWPEGAPSLEERISILVDADWYSKLNKKHCPDPSVAKSHFLRVGLRDGRNPNPYFHAEWYRNTYSVPRNVDIAEHYLRYGAAEGIDPNPFFSDEWYRNAYMGDCPEWLTSLEHYLTTGRFLGLKPHPMWFEEEYVKGNKDVWSQIKAGTYDTGYAQFCEVGYLQVNSFAHRRVPFFLSGKLIDFDEGVYLDDNPDVARLVAEKKYRDGLTHFFLTGYRECEDALRAPFSSKRIPKMISAFSGVNEKIGEHIALFAHYDADGIVDEYVFDYLESIISFGVDVVFITSACREVDLNRLREICKSIIIKNDAGRDFGSWYLAIKYLGLEYFDRYNCVFFLNDSVYFPVRDPSPIFLTMPGRFNFWGLVDTYGEGQYHIQSWFLAFDAKARAKIFPWFVARYERNLFLSKWGQIIEYELGITARAREEGLSVGAWNSISDIKEDVLHKPELRRWKKMASNIFVINPTHHLWDLLITRYGCPALKLELVRDNPAQIRNVDSYPALLDEKTRTVVTAHAARQKCGASVVDGGTTVRFTSSPASDELEVLHTFEGVRPEGRRLVLLAHYDADGILDPHVLHAMDALRSSDCDIIFITGSKSEDCWEQAKSRAIRVLVKTDVARDFGSWFLAVRTYKDLFQHYECVVWMNDSIYFPLIDPGRMFSQMEKYDFWGLADSYLEKYHVMSWFWVFGSKLIKNNWFEDFERDFSPHYKKWEQIRNFEMRYPGMFLKEGLSVGSWISATEVLGTARLSDKGLGADANVMHDCWKMGILKFSFPAIKVELLRDNPLGVDISGVLDVVREHTIYDPALIQEHLRRVKCRHIFDTERGSRSGNASAAD